MSRGLRTDKQAKKKLYECLNLKLKVPRFYETLVISPKTCIFQFHQN